MGTIDEKDFELIKDKIDTLIALKVMIVGLDFFIHLRERGVSINEEV